MQVRHASLSKARLPLLVLLLCLLELTGDRIQRPYGFYLTGGSQKFRTKYMLISSAMVDPILKERLI